MSPTVVRAFATVAAVTTLACSDSLAPEDIIGTWNATSMQFTSVADPTTSVEVIMLGASFEMVFANGGVVTLTFTDGTGSETDIGTWVLDGETITITIDGEMSSGAVALSGSTLTVVLTTGVEFDFDDDDVDEDATVYIVMTRE